MVRLSEIKLHNRETAIEATGGARTPRRLYAPPTPHTECGGLLGLEQGCHHLPATSTNRGIELHSNMVINPGTTPTLMSTTLALRKNTLVYPGP